MIKYAIVPGYVRASDGDVHWITANQLMDLYRVTAHECKVVRNEDSLRGYTPEFIDSLIYLHPRSDGAYEIPEEV